MTLRTSGCDIGVSRLTFHVRAFFSIGGWDAAPGGNKNSGQAIQYCSHGKTLDMEETVKLMEAINDMKQRKLPG